MRLFFLKFIAFFSPVILFLVVPGLVLFLSGESYREIDDFVKKENRYLIGLVYGEDNSRYAKLVELEKKERFDIVALGSSRVLQFRDSMFTSSFYNAGYTISSISDFLPFVKHYFTLKSMPEVFIVGLDQWMFNENWDDLSPQNPEKRWNHHYDTKISGKVFFEIWRDLLAGKYDLNDIYQNYIGETNKVGLNAIVNENGFRQDGSRFYGSQIRKLIKKDSSAADFKFEDTFTRIRNGNRRFQYGQKINNDALKVLDRFLQFCKEQQLHVVAFLPPFADEVNKKIAESGSYTYIDSIYTKVNNLCKTYNYELWDLSSLKSYNSGDSEVLDGFHGSEVAYMRMLIYMIEKGSNLKDFTNLSQLKSDLQNKENNYSVYKNSWE